MPPPGEVWIPPRQAEGGNTVAGTVQTAAQRVEKDDGGTYETVEKARADLIAADHDLQRQKELARLCNSLGGRDVEVAYERYLQAKAALERAEAKVRLRR
jgi:multidrug resistance efflux pump